MNIKIYGLVEYKTFRRKTNFGTSGIKNNYEILINLFQL